MTRGKTMIGLSVLVLGLSAGSTAQSAPIGVDKCGYIVKNPLCKPDASKKRSPTVAGPVEQLRPKARVEQLRPKVRTQTR
jgi:hypothetical protein